MRFVVVLILGVAIGLLVAPQRGSETIRVLRERAQQWRSRADEEGDPVSE